MEPRQQSAPTAHMPTKPAKPETEPTFDTAVERLEQLVEMMESDRMPLDELLVRYEEGTKLVKFCQEQLDAAERRIEIVTRNSKGESQIEPFEPDAAPSTQAKAKASPKAADEVSLF